MQEVFPQSFQVLFSASVLQGVNQVFPSKRVAFAKYGGVQSQWIRPSLAKLSQELIDTCAPIAGNTGKILPALRQF